MALPSEQETDKRHRLWIPTGATCETAQSEPGLELRSAAALVVLFEPRRCSAFASHDVAGRGMGWTHQDSIRVRSGRLTYRILIFSYERPLTTEELTGWAERLVSADSSSMAA